MIWGIAVATSPGASRLFNPALLTEAPHW